MKDERTMQHFLIIAEFPDTSAITLLMSADCPQQAVEMWQDYQSASDPIDGVLYRVYRLPPVSSTAYTNDLDDLLEIEHIPPPC
jgi:hypothetical protein